MRQNSGANIRVSKAIARQKYKERQINKYVNWAIESRGYLKWKEMRDIARFNAWREFDPYSKLEQ